MKRYRMAAVLAIVLLAGCGPRQPQVTAPPAKPDAGALLSPPKADSNAKPFEFAPGGGDKAGGTDAAKDLGLSSGTKLPEDKPAPTGAPAVAPKPPAAAQTPPPAAKPSATPGKAPYSSSVPAAPTTSMQEPPKATASPSATSAPKPAEQDLLTPPMAGGGTKAP